MFDTVLIANRGEIALRVHRACKSMGLKTVAIHSEVDADLRHVQLADQRLCIGPSEAGQSYLDISKILIAARLTGAGAIHPGYGFLSENAELAQALEDNNLTFIGPSAATIRLMGDKVSAKRTMIKAKVPCVPGSEGTLPEDPQVIREIADSVGYPLIVKAAGGGGGRGMRIVRTPNELNTAVTMTRREAQNAFRNPDVYMERYLENPRHIEIQVMADKHGQVLWLGERDCSMQRRNQKLIEESPAPWISREDIAALGARCAKACLAIGYVGVGTFEFLYEDGKFYFIEMNTRVQVEHPVTEMVTGIDIVREQIRIARGDRLSISQNDIVMSGHAIECRINAENHQTFLPSPGRIEQWIPPGGPGIRIESHLYSGYTIPSNYDSLVAKVIAYGQTRDLAIERLAAALEEIEIAGVSTTVPLHKRLMQEDDFIRGGFGIHFLERRISEGLFVVEDGDDA